MFLRRINNRSGMILVVVIAFIVVISILVAGMLSRNVITATSSEDQVKSSQADLLSRGALWKVQPSIDQGTFVSPTSWPETVNNVVYTVTVTKDAAGKVVVKVTY